MKCDNVMLSEGFAIAEAKANPQSKHPYFPTLVSATVTPDAASTVCTRSNDWQPCRKLWTPLYSLCGLLSSPEKYSTLTVAPTRVGGKKKDSPFRSNWSDRKL